MPKGRSQAHLNNYSGGVARQFGGRAAGLSASPFPQGNRQMHDYTGLDDTGVDFLSRLELAEKRDNMQRLAGAAPTPHEKALANPYAQSSEHVQMRQKHRHASSIMLGGDAPATGYSPADIYSTTNSRAASDLESGLKSAHETLITKQLMQQHGLSKQDLDRGGEKAQRWLDQQIQATQMASGQARRQQHPVGRGAPMGVQRSGMPMLRQH